MEKTLWSDWDMMPFRDGGDEQNHPARILTVEMASIGTTVLDCGCATCIDYEHFQERNADIEYYGIDLTPEFVEGARKLYPEANVQLGSITDISFGDRAIDTVYCRNVLEHLPPGGIWKALTEMWRVANMQIIVSFFMRPSLEASAFEQDGNGFYNNRYSYLDLLPFLLALAGFKSLEVIENLGQDNAVMVVVQKEAVNE